MNGNRSPFPGETRAARRGFARTALSGLAVFLLAWTWASAGIEWSMGFHPDELVVARWAERVRSGGVVEERAYPGGWFELARVKEAFDRKARRFGAARERHRVQDGLVNATDSATFRRKALPGAAVRNALQWCRDFNALLYAATALVLFLAALEAGLGTAGAAVSAAFFLSLPSPLEHAHYAETDLGVLFSLALSFWAMAAAARRGSLPLALAAGFASGFCVSCKYTVAPLALVPPALGAFLGARGRRSGRAAAWAGLALLATLAGFLAGTPVLYRAPDVVRKALSGGRKQVSEAGGALVKLGSLVRETLKAGVLPLLWAAVSVPFWFRRPWRRALFGPALFVPLFFAGVFAILPWFRNQESLPLLAVLSLGAGLPAAAALRLPPEERRRRAPLLAAGAALLAAALCSGLLSSARILSAFERREMRAECHEFLSEGFPRDGRAAVETYAFRALSGTEGNFVVRDHIPENYPASLSKPKVRDADPRYLIYDASHEKRRGRRREALTGRPVAAARASLEAFRRDATLLRAWDLPAGWRRPVFAQHDAELWLLPLPADSPGRGLAGVPVAFERPLLAVPFGAPLQEASGPTWFGPLEAARAVGRRTEILVPRDGVPRWAVVRHLAPSGPPLRIEWKGPFRPLSPAPLAPGGAAVAAAPAASPRTPAPGIFSVSRVRVRGGGETETPCLVFLTSDPAEAAFSLRRAGDPAGGLALLRGAPGALATDAGRVEAFLCASASGVAPDPAWRRSAEDALAAFDALRAAVAEGPFPAAATLCGVPLEAMRDFARLRAGAGQVLPGCASDLYLPAGDYRVEVAFPPSRAEDVVGRILFEGQTAPFEALDEPPESPRAAAALRQPADGFLRFRADLAMPPADDVLVLRGYEVSWDFLRPVADTAEEIRSALRSRSAPPTE